MQAGIQGYKQRASLAIICDGRKNCTIHHALEWIFQTELLPARKAEGEAPILLDTVMSARSVSTAVLATMVATRSLKAVKTFPSIFSKIAAWKQQNNEAMR